MSLTARRCIALSAVLTGFLVLYSCSGPVPPQPGTPGFSFLAAKETFAAGDYMKTIEHLDDVLLKDTGEYAARALPWSLILTSGMAAGHMEMADAYEKGSKLNKADPLPFRRQIDLNRGAAGRLVLQFADHFLAFNKLTMDSVPLAFGVPKGSAAEFPQLLKITTGIVPSTADVETAEQRAIERNVILAASKAVGASEDTAKAAQLLAVPDAKVSRATFELAMANSLFAMAHLYAPDKLYDPEKQGILYQRAQDALKNVPESDDSKALTQKIVLARKQLPKKS
jgi:hypothetical protein